MRKTTEHWCRSCGGRIERSPGSADPLACPYCGAGDPLATADAGPQGLLARNRSIWLIITAVALVLFIALGFWYRRFLLSGWDLVAEATGGRTSALLAIVGILLALGWLLVWMLLPFFVYFGLKDLKRRMGQLDRTTRLCTHHLARASAAQAPPEKARRPAPMEPAPDAESP
jgi:hypothetical protein